MILRTKKIAGLLVFLLISSTAVMAQTGQNEVSDAELSKFAITFQKMRMMNQEAQLKMSEVISSEDMEVKRFNEIHKATLDPAIEVEVTAEEQELYEDIVEDIEKIQLSYQEKIEDTIEEEGLSVERYQQIATGLQTDPELQERLKKEFED